MDESEVDFVKVTIRMPQAMHDDLKRRARADGITVTELMRRGVGWYKHIQDHPDATVMLVEDGEMRELVLLP